MDSFAVCFCYVQKSVCVCERRLVFGSIERWYFIRAMERWNCITHPGSIHINLLCVSLSISVFFFRRNCFYFLSLYQRDTTSILRDQTARKRSALAFNIVWLWFFVRIRYSCCHFSVAAYSLEIHTHTYDSLIKIVSLVSFVFHFTDWWPFFSFSRYRRRRRSFVIVALNVAFAISWHRWVRCLRTYNTTRIKLSAHHSDNSISHHSFV